MRLFILIVFISIVCIYFMWARWTVRDIDYLQGAAKSTYVKFFVPGVYFLFSRFCKIFPLALKEERYEKLRRMYLGMEERELFFHYYCKMGSVMAGIFLAGMVLLAGSCLVHSQTDIKESRYLTRQDVSGGERSVSFQANNGVEERDITVSIPEREYSLEERKRAFDAVEREIKKALPGENASLDKVITPLVLLNEVQGFAIEITWELGEGLINEDGTIENEGITKPVQRQITAVLSYGDEERRVAQMLTVYPGKQTFAQRFWQEWEKLWKESEKGSRTKEYIKLPDGVMGKSISYEQKTSVLFPYILGGMLAMILLVPVWQQSRMREGLNKRQEQLNRDYPEFVEHFVLLIGAGLTVKGTWERIVRDYKNRQGEQHYVYEEMALSLREMDCGMSEARAYELFGKRTGLLSYMKFCTLIVQNLRKGSSDLLLLLDYEAADAYHQRKEIAKELGEKAGTKLLLPMVVMLALVFVIILYAAFQSM